MSEELKNTPENVESQEEMKSQEETTQTVSEEIVPVADALPTPAEEETVTENIPTKEEIVPVAEALPTPEEEKEETFNEGVLPTENPVDQAHEKAPRKHVHIENAYESLDNFSWDSLEKKGHKYNETEQSRLEELYTKSFKSIAFSNCSPVNSNIVNPIKKDIFIEEICTL